MRIGFTKIILLSFAAVWVGLAGGSLLAQGQNNAERSFSLQVTPSPIIENIKPGVTQTTELKIRNTSNAPETLKMELKSFRFNEESGEAELLEEEPKEVKDWVSFSDPIFSIAQGAVFNQKIILATPADAGFSYYFAVVIKRAGPTTPSPGQQSLEGSVAVFTLLSVDRPDAKRSFSILEFSSKRKLYEYLPAEFTLKVKNTGNTIAKPGGNVFIQRSSKSNNPIDVLPANPDGSLVLPDTYRNLTIEWANGFPVFQNVSEAENVEPEKRLTWDWGKAGDIRIGKFVAKVVAVYNDGQRDVPVQAEVSFWVVPWKMILILGALIVLLFIGFTSTAKSLLKIGRKSPAKKTSRKLQHEDQPEKKEDEKD